MKIYYCDCCGKEISKRVLPGDNMLAYVYHTKEPIDGYYSTRVILHLCNECHSGVESGEKHPKPIEEVADVVFATEGKPCIYYY